MSKSQFRYTRKKQISTYRNSENFGWNHKKNQLINFQTHYYSSSSKEYVKEKGLWKVREIEWIWQNLGTSNDMYIYGKGGKVF